MMMGRNDVVVDVWVWDPSGETAQESLSLCSLCHCLTGERERERVHRIPQDITLQLIQPQVKSRQAKENMIPH